MTVWCVICRKVLKKPGGLVLCLCAPEGEFIQGPTSSTSTARYGRYLKLHACAGACYEEAERRVVEVLMKETGR